MLTKAIALLAVSLSLVPVRERLTRQTNSQAASARGVREYSKQQYGPAVEDFRRANEIRPSATRSFNLGTSQIAAGRREEGSQTLAAAMNDPAMRADALYNRGNSAFAAKAYDYAVRDYVETLRLRPGDQHAKRNLELALRQLEEQQKQQGGQQGGQEPQSAGGGNGQPKPQSGSQPGKEDQKRGPDGKNEGGSGEAKTKGDRSVEALLRGIQQQEGEELQRMKKARAQGQKVGW